MGLGKTRSPGQPEREEGDEVDRAKGKVVIVTGSAKDTGRSACSLLAREDIHVWREHVRASLRSTSVGEHHGH
jgi:hypothetical protein